MTLRIGNCDHHAHIPRLVDLVASGVVDPTRVTSQREGLTDAISAYEAFDQRQPSWLKVERQLSE